MKNTAIYRDFVLCEGVLVDVIGASQAYFALRSRFSSRPLLLETEKAVDIQSPERYICVAR